MLKREVYVLPGESSRNNILAPRSKNAHSELKGDVLGMASLLFFTANVRPFVESQVFRVPHHGPSHTGNANLRFARAVQPNRYLQPFEGWDILEYSRGQGDQVVPVHLPLTSVGRGDWWDTCNSALEPRNNQSQRYTSSDGVLHPLMATPEHYRAPTELRGRFVVPTFELSLALLRYEGSLQRISNKVITW